MKIVSQNSPYIIPEMNINRNISYTSKQYRPVKVMDIGLVGVYPTTILSNFSDTHFTLDGVEINSMEGFLQSLKVQDVDKQKEICKLDGPSAKRAARAFKPQESDLLMFWQGEEFKKGSDRFKELVEEAAKLSESSEDKSFVFGGINFNSVDNFILSLQVPDEEVKAHIGKIAPKKIKNAATNYKKIFDRTLYWQGQPMGRTSKEYFDLLTRAYTERFKNDSEFRIALRAAEGYKLTHSIGKSNIRETILTEQEFCTLLKETALQDSIGYKVKDFFTRSAKLFCK